MAQATLLAIDPPDDDSGLWFLLSADLSTFPAFEGAPDRDWATFTVFGDGEATFDWHTPGERCVDLARRVQHGELSVERALADADLRDYLVRLETLLGDEGGARERLVREIAAGILKPTTWGALSYYDVDGTEHLADAARSLPMPPWGHWEWAEIGGPSSPDLLCLVLDEGHDLHDLGEFLDAIANGAKLRLVTTHAVR